MTTNYQRDVGRDELTYFISGPDDAFMVSLRSLTYLSMVISVVMAVASVAIGDIFWIVIAAVDLILMSSTLTENSEFYYNKAILWSTIVSALLYVVYVVLQMTVDPLGDALWMEVPVDFYISTLFQSMMAFALGMAFITLMDARGVITLTKRWMVLYAMMFALMISVISLFFTFVYLYEMGVPVFNGDVAETGHHESNNIMMTSAFVTTFATPFYAYFTIRMIRGKGKDVFTVKRCSE